MNKLPRSETIPLGALYRNSISLYSSSTSYGLVIIIFITKNRLIFVYLFTTTNIAFISSPYSYASGNPIMKFIEISYYGPYSSGNDYSSPYGRCRFAFDP